MEDLRIVRYSWYATLFAQLLFVQLSIIYKNIMVSVESYTCSSLLFLRTHFYSGPIHIEWSTILDHEMFERLFQGTL